MRLVTLGMLLCLLIASSQVATAEHESGGPSEKRGTADPLIIVTQDAEVDPPACRPYRVAVRSLRFMEALATADRRALLGRFWGSNFKAFSVPTKPGQGLPSFGFDDSPERIVKALRKRGGIQIRLTGIEVFVGPGVKRALRVNPTGFWRPPAGGPEVPFSGAKARVRCDSPGIPLWVVGTSSEAPPVPSRCPPPAEPPPEGVETLIACAVTQ